MRALVRPMRTSLSRLLLSLWVLMSVGSSTAAQRVLARNYTEADGLPSSRVNDVREGPSGLLWFATRAGLHEYDGTSWEPALESILRPGQEVLFVRFDRAGAAWTLCANGTLETSTRDERSRPAQLPRELRASLFHDFALGYPDGRPAPAIASAAHGLLLWREGSWITPDLGGAERHPMALEACFDRLYLGARDGLFVLDGAAPAPWQAELPPGPVRGLCAHRSDDGPELWICGDGWVGRVEDDRRFSLIATDLPRLSTPDDSPLALVPDGRGGFVFGNALAIHHFDARTGDTGHLDRTAGLRVEGVHALHRDSTGLIWGASALGAFKLHALDTAGWTAAQGLLADEVTAIAELPDGRVALGHQGGLTVMARESPTRLPFAGVDPDQPAGWRVLDMCVDASGRLACAVPRLGVGRLGADGDLTWTPIPDGEHRWCNAVQQDGTGALLVGTSRGLLRLVEDAFEEVALPGERRPYVRRITRTRAGETVLATTTGVWISAAEHARSGWRNLKPAQNDPGLDHFYTVLEDHAGRLWCGGVDGLWLVVGDELVRGDGPRESRRPVYALTEDDLGRLWVGTDFGFEFIDGERRVPLEWMAAWTGYEANRAAAACDRNGNVWLGTTRGLTVFRPQFDVPRDAPELEFLEVRVGGEVQPVTRTAHVPDGGSEVAFRVRARSLLVEEGIEFRSRLDGLTDWQSTRSSTVLESRFLGLPPGRYTYEVQARVPGGEYGPVLRSTPVIARGPLWTRAWFLLLAMGATGALSVAGYRALLLRRHAAQLEKEVESRTRALEGSLQELAKTDRLRTLGLLGGGIAHDLRNVLTVATGNLSLLAAHHEDARSRELVESADEALDRATQLASQLQTFATGGAPLTRATSLADLIRESGRIVLAGSRVSLELEVEDDLQPGQVDPAQIRQVYENLLVNARQCQAEGGWIRVRGRNVVVEPESEDARDLRPGRYVCITVSDGGPGIPEDLVERVFEPLFSTKGAGSGLGLASARSIVERHGGRLAFEPGASGGATFLVWLPVSQDVPARPLPAESPGAPVSGTRVLVVDDEEPIRNLLRRMLGRLDFVVDVAAGESEALRLAAAAREEGRPYRIAVLDLTLPGDSPGPVILARLRRIEPGLRAVATSGYSEDDVLSRPAEFGFQCALPKPFRLADLQRALRDVRSSAPRS